MNRRVTVKGHIEVLTHLPGIASNATILIVDDTPENLRVLSDLLQPAYRVVAANSGKRALQLAVAAPRPDLILLDIMMPQLDGYTVLARLKADPVTQDIPVIFVTALNSDADEQRGLELGAVDYITKPFHPAIVLARVRTQLELKQAQDRLKDQNLWLEAEVARRVAENELILANAAEGIFGTDTQGIISFINPAALDMLGYAHEELIGQNSHAKFHHSKPDGSPNPVEMCPMHTTLATGIAVRNTEELFWCRNGSPLPVEFSSMPMQRDGKLVGVVVSFSDIRERKQYLAQLEHQANYDELTELPNRNLLTDRLARTMAHSSREGSTFAVLLLNLDRFKEINDTLGRDIGDAVLRQTAQRLAGDLRKTDTLARVAGDEFVILLDGDEVAATEKAQSILTALGLPLTIEQRELFLSVSIGIAEFPKDGAAGEILLKNAAAAMYRAKAAGGNVFRFYAADMNARSLERLELENDLRRALERNELVIYYQPQLSLRSGGIIGCEALLRWRHPQRGLVPPGAFIPLAEDTGLIVAIGEWVLRTACIQNKAWQDAGLPPVTVAVNMSAQQFAAQDVVAMAGAILRETGLDPATLELELTESAVMADADAFIHATEDLKDLHITLSIDDFGTGFSSLSYLKRFALDRLKIDLSFVRDITQDPDSASIALAIISLAHSLKLSVIAEGVETEAQLGYLRTHGCDEMQGFYFSKPVPADEFESLLRERRMLKTADAIQAAPQTLLLVDDEPNILTALKRLLRREGYTVLSATSGREGLDLLAQQPVGVVISDARMPEMDGPEFLRRVRGLHPDTLRIMLTGYTDLKAVTDAVNSGELFKFLTKPWEDQELLNAIRDAFRQYEMRAAQRRATQGLLSPGGATD